jgi:beta-phosphoglucomutase
LECIYLLAPYRELHPTTGDHMPWTESTPRERQEFYAEPNTLLHWHVQGKKMKTIGILLDYNGVIADDEDLHESAFSKVIAEFGFTSISSLYAMYILGRADIDGFERLRTHFPQQLANTTADELARRKHDAYQDLAFKHDMLYPGAIDVLHDLERDCRLVIVTGASRKEVMPVLEHYRIATLFEQVIDSEDVAKGKPDPEGYLRGLNALRLSRESVIVIEDSPPGVQAAKAAGLTCIAVLHTTGRDQLLGADAVVDNIKAIDVALINQVLSGVATTVGSADP